jgi:hypothetical protein
MVVRLIEIYHFFPVAQPLKPKTKPNLVIHQAETPEVPKVTFEETMKHLESSIHPKAQPGGLLVEEHTGDNLCSAKKTKRPVVLFNKEDKLIPVKQQPKTLVVIQKKLLPLMTVYRWHNGFRQHLGRYIRVSVMKLELHYPEELHDILVSRELELTLGTSSNLSWVTKGKVIGHKCLVEFVIHEKVPTQNLDDHFLLQVKSNFEASDLEDFSIDLGKYQLNNWLQFVFDEKK